MLTILMVFVGLCIIFAIAAIIAALGPLLLGILVFIALLSLDIFVLKKILGKGDKK